MDGLAVDHRPLIGAHFVQYAGDSVGGEPQTAKSLVEVAELAGHHRILAAFDPLLARRFAALYAATDALSRAEALNYCC